MDDEAVPLGAVLRRLRDAGFTDSADTVRRLVERGVLRGYTMESGHRRIYLSSVDELIAKRQQAAAPPEPQ